MKLRCSVKCLYDFSPFKAALMPKVDVEHEVFSSDRAATAPRVRHDKIRRKTYSSLSIGDVGVLVEWVAFVCREVQMRHGMEDAMADQLKKIG